MVEYLKPDQAAGILKVDVSTLRRWRKENIGPPYVLTSAGRPCYRADLLHHGQTRLKGLQAVWPAENQTVVDPPESEHLSTGEAIALINRILAE